METNTTKTLEERAAEIVQKYDGDYHLPETFARKIVNLTLDACREKMETDPYIGSSRSEVLEAIDSLRTLEGKETV